MRSIKGGEFEGRGLHCTRQPGGPLALGTGDGIGVKFRGQNDVHFAGPGAVRGALEGALKRPESAASHLECI